MSGATNPPSPLFEHEFYFGGRVLALDRCGKENLEGDTYS
jgi:hypothetical protein